MANTIKLKQLDQTQLAAFINELIDGTGAVYTASRAVVTDSLGDITTSSVTSTELGYVSGVTSAIQTQLNAKQATITGAATSITSSNLTVSRALTSDGSGKVAVSSVTSTELGYVSGVTSAIQTQINAKFTLPSLTSGSVLFSNGSTISQDNSNLFWDNTNKRLGIGGTPSYRFHIIGTTSTMVVQYQNTTSNSSVYFQLFDNNTFEYYYSNNSGYYQIRATQTRVQGIGAGYVVLTVKGASSQSANLQQWQNSSATVLANIASDGVFQAAGYKSSDGSTGATGTATLANTLTIKNGLVTNIA